MALVIGGVMGQRAQREGIFVEILRLAHQVHDEIAAADIVHQVAEESAAERVVAHVLQNAAAIGVGVGLQQIVRGGVGESRQQERLDIARPRPCR